MYLMLQSHQFAFLQVYIIFFCFRAFAHDFALIAMFLFYLILPFPGLVLFFNTQLKLFLLNKNFHDSTLRNIFPLYF